MGHARIDPAHHDAAVFDLDGVVTDTASVHFAAWKQLFDSVLAARPERPGEDHAPFTSEDYRRLVDGRPRYEGVAAFLSSRGIDLPWGEASDDADAATVCGFGNRKNQVFHERLATDGVRVFGSTLWLVARLAALGVRPAVFSASRNARRVLEVAGLQDLFEARVDGEVADELGLAGKPDPAVPLEATRRVGAEPARTVLVEDAIAGVAAGRRGGFGLVIGIDRDGAAERLTASGADVVVADLGEVEVTHPQRPLADVPDALALWPRLAPALVRRPLALACDFDGTLAGIVDEPAEVEAAPGAAGALGRLARRCAVAIVSGRGLDDMRARLPVDGVWYAGSHGFELAGPDGKRHDHPDAEAAVPALDEAEHLLRRRLEPVAGVLVERKPYGIAAHYRQVAEGDKDKVIAAVEHVAGDVAGLRATGGRQVVELRPDLDWDKGRALRWLLQRMAPEGARAAYIGDDLTDEDALAEIRGDGLGVAVRPAEPADRLTDQREPSLRSADRLTDQREPSLRSADRLTAALVAVDGPVAVVALLGRLADMLYRSQREDR